MPRFKSQFSSADERRIRGDMSYVKRREEEKSSIPEEHFHFNCAACHRLMVERIFNIRYSSKDDNEQHIVQDKSSM